MAGTVLLVVDMQEGLLQGAPKHDLGGVVERINRLAARVRRRGGCVVFVQARTGSRVALLVENAAETAGL